MQVRIAICDDEQIMLDKIKDKVSEISNTVNVKTDIYTYSEAKRAVEVLCCLEEYFDILLLDVDMPELSGLEVAKLVRECRDNLILIFISSHEQYVFESIEYNPFRYIRKNRISEELPLALKAAFTRLENENDKSIIVKTDDGEIRLFHSEIMYYEIQNRRLKIHLDNGKIISTWKTIKDQMNEMNDEKFIKLHSGCVVNVMYISGVSNFDVTLDNNERLIVSRRRVRDVKAELLRYWRGKM